MRHFPIFLFIAVILLVIGCSRSTTPSVSVQAFSESMRYISKADVYVDTSLFRAANACLTNPYPSIAAFSFDFSTKDEQTITTERSVAAQSTDCLSTVAQISSVGRTVDNEERVRISCRVAVDQEGRVLALKQLSGPRRTVAVLPCFANYRYAKDDNAACIATGLLTMRADSGM